jgi:hypothetical protein
MRVFAPLEDVPNYLTRPYEQAHGRAGYTL